MTQPEAAQSDQPVLRLSSRRLRETVQLVVNSMDDVVQVGSFGRAVDPIRLVTAWHTELGAALSASAEASHDTLRAAVQGLVERWRKVGAPYYSQACADELDRLLTAPRGRIEEERQEKA